MNSRYLRQKHPVFYYHGFAKKLTDRHLELSFNFEIEPRIFFHPKIIIENVKPSQIEHLGPAFDNLVFNLGLAEIPSYWKATCSPTIVIKAGNLTDEQIAFWHKLLIKGMGQFYYQNKIDFTKKNFLKISSFSSFRFPSSPSQPSLPSSRSYLIPLGGGKDSIVALEILKKAGLSLNVCMTNPPQASLDISRIADYKKPIIVKRIIDPKLLALNQRGYLNGHVPITANLSFIYMLCATLFGFSDVVFANERSADEENFAWKGLKINHQYSKSLEFENDFRAYCQKYLITQVNYFSFLRPLYELQITRLFARYPKYFKVFRSCNAGLKTNSWCCACPKCLSVFLHLSAFLPQEKMIEIFGQNLFAKEKLLPTLRQLSGIEGFKPFECVGTIQENLAATWLVLKKVKKLLPILLQIAYQYLKSINYNQQQADKIINDWNNEHNLSTKLLKLLKQFK